LPNHQPGKRLSIEVAIPFGLNVRGVILADQVKSLDWRARNAEVVAPLPADTIDEVLEKIGVLLARDDR
jgi:mRNA interferase MazF